MSIAYSVSTGPYTADQLDGEDCARCGETFIVGEKSRPSVRVAGYQLFVHVSCPKRGATR